MNFKITKSKISEPLSLLASVAESRQSIPILSNIYIKAENNSISLIATDLEIELSFKINCDSINEQGETTVSARKIFDLKKNINQLRLDKDLIVFVILKQISLAKSTYFHLIPYPRFLMPMLIYDHQLLPNLH